MADPKAAISPTGYYMLHSCGDSADHQDSCDAVFVWASSPAEALSLDPEGRDAETIEVKRAAESDEFHGLLEARFGNGYGKSGPIEDRAYRALSFHEDGGTSCDTCSLWEFESVPESKVCPECTQCAECECVCGERLADAIREAEASARSKAFEECARILENALTAMATVQTVADGLDECAAWGRCMILTIRARAKEAPRG